MGKGKGTRSKAGGANEAILRRDRELRDKNARAEKDDIDDHDTKNERFISFLSNSNKNSGKTGESDDDEDADDDAAFDLAAGGSSSEDEDEDKESGESNSDEGSENASGDEVRACFLFFLSLLCAYKFFLGMIKHLEY